MRNRGSEPETLFESVAQVADAIRQMYCNHAKRSRMTHALESMLMVHEDYACPEYLLQLYTLHQILYAMEAGCDGRTHGEVKDHLALFSLVARQFRKDILDKKPPDYEDRAARAEAVDNGIPF